MDWTKQGYTDEISAQLIDPHNLDSVRGEMKDLILSGSSISYGYNTDTRVSAKLQTYGNSYISNSWIRLVHRRGTEMRELGTFVLQTRPEVSSQYGKGVYTYNLQSVLWTLSNDLCNGHFSIGAGAYSRDVFERICNTCGRSWIHKAGARNYRYGATKIYDVGDSYLSFLFDLCDSANNRLNVDGHGRITDEPYFTPSNIEATWTIDADDPHTLLLSDEITESATNENIPGRAIVIYTSGDTEIVATADRGSSSPYSSAQRGYMVASKYQVSDMSPATQARAQQLAKQYLDETAETIQLQCKTLYFPCETGETLYLIRNNEQKKYLLQSIELSLDTMNQSLTLKEVS